MENKCCQNCQYFDETSPSEKHGICMKEKDDQKGEVNTDECNEFRKRIW